MKYDKKKSSKSFIKMDVDFIHDIILFEKDKIKTSIQ